MSGRKIVHIDMDAFYASVEQRDNPELRGKPVVVAWKGKRSVVCAASYEARRFGVRSAMAATHAERLCPEAVFVPPDFTRYRAASHAVREIFLRHTELIEPLSLDEAYLDVTGLDRYAWDIAKEIRKRIFAETRLTASAGVAPNKMLAKIASDWLKPNGQFAITPDQIETFVRDLPVRKLWGVGPKSVEKFEQQGIRTCGDLQKVELAELVRRHGKWGNELYQLSRGLDDRPVEPNRIRKSLSNESTFIENLTTLEQCRQELDRLVAELEEELRAKAADRQIHKAFVKVKFADFTRTTRECICAHPTQETFQRLLEEAYKRSPQPIRLLGSGVRFSEGKPEVRDVAQQLLGLAR